MTQNCNNVIADFLWECAESSGWHCGGGTAYIDADERKKIEILYFFYRVFCVLCTLCFRLSGATSRFAVRQGRRSTIDDSRRVENSRPVLTISKGANITTALVHTFFY
jgi:hypothetical protein